MVKKRMNKLVQTKIFSKQQPIPRAGNLHMSLPGVGTAPLLHFPKVACYYYTTPEM